MPDNFVMPAPIRPARPLRFPYELLREASRAAELEPKQVYSVTRDLEGRFVVTTRDHRVYVVCTPEAPDGRGQTGPLFDRARSAHPGNRYDREKIYCDPAEDWSSMWTGEDLDIEAWRSTEKPLIGTVPAGTNANGGRAMVQTFMPWVGFDPVKARMVWLAVAKQLRLTPGEAVHRAPDAAACRRVVLDSGWMADGEVPRLDEDLTPPALAARAEATAGAAA